MRDRGALEAALARRQNLAAYGDPDVADIVAAYVFGIVRGHPFVDGNKRTGAVVLELSLKINGFHLAASDDALLEVMRAVAAGEMDQDAFVTWIRLNLT
jgi:death-on-curing protein